MSFLLSLVIIIGTKTDLRLAAPKLKADLSARRVVLIEDRHATERFPNLTGQYYRARWARRVSRLKPWINSLPDAVVVLGRETVPNEPCAKGSTVMCSSAELPGCSVAVSYSICGVH